MRTKRSMGIALAAAVALSGCSDREATTSASNDVTTLRFSHFMTANDNINTEGFEPWAEKIEEAENRRNRDFGLP